MPQVANLGVRLQWGFVVVDDDGNTHEIPGSQPIHIQEPSEAAFKAAYERWAAERDTHRARLAEAREQQLTPANGKMVMDARQPIAAGVEE